MNLGLAIKKVRCQCGLTQKDLAALLGVTVVHVSYMENGRRFPSNDTVDRILSVFEISRDELYFAALDINRERSICHIMDEFQRLQLISEEQ